MTENLKLLRSFFKKASTETPHSSTFRILSFTTQEIRSIKKEKIDMENDNRGGERNVDIRRCFWI